MSDQLISKVDDWVRPRLRGSTYRQLIPVPFGKIIEVDRARFKVREPNGRTHVVGRNEVEPIRKDVRFD